MRILFCYNVIIITLQAHKGDNGYSHNHYLFDGFVQISFQVIKDEDDDDINIFRAVEIELHKNQESLNRAKNSSRSARWKRIRMDVYPD